MMFNFSKIVRKFSCLGPEIESSLVHEPKASPVSTVSVTASDTLEPTRLERPNSNMFNLGRILQRRSCIGPKIDVSLVHDPKASPASTDVAKVMINP
jgi:hypothetical protein